MTTRPEGPLAPTLWRTCRVLANPVRLKMLQVLLRDGELPVSVVAGRVGVAPLLGSQYLRALSARGLLAARRDGRWVYYRAAADPSARGASALLGALRRTFAFERDPVGVTYRAATAFTHPRRLRVVQALARAAAPPRALARQTGISRFALHRHLDKLARRGVVQFNDGTWRLMAPRRPLPALLLKLACKGG